MNNKTALTHCAATLMLLVGVQVHAQGTSGDRAKAARDSYNQVAMMYGLLRNGIAAAAVKRQILDATDIGSLPPETRSRYRALVDLADQVAAVRADSRTGGTENGGAADPEVLSDIVESGTSIAAAVASGGSTSMVQGTLSLLSAVGDVRALDNEAIAPGNALQEQLRSELTDFEFSLSEWRGILRDAHELDRDALVSVDDFRTFQNLGAQGRGYTKQEIERIRVLVERNPGMYPAVLELARWELWNNRALGAARDHARQVLDHIPHVISRSRARATAHGVLAMTHLGEGRVRQAREMAEAGLDENPEDVLALLAAIGAAMEAGEHQESLGYLGRLTALHPDEPTFERLRAHNLTALGRADQAVSALESAMRDGFSDIASLSDEPFTKLHSRDDFLRLTSPSVNVNMNWNALTPDEVVIRNTNAFAWTNVQILPVYRIRGDSQSFRYTESKSGYQWDRIPAGAEVDFDVFDSVKTNVKWLRLHIRSDQGAMRIPLIYRRDGSFQFGETESRFAWE